ncbi:hypothetical protein ACHHYP_10411 [Achlya hypogyna]|uniref:Reverse transcriptase domain-containing protein n=1 Tax=Achlya hypogyna TaxID=1202772 RepID=A0A1V9YLH3_ACHHY|nr:hypothetical protein ACHHYP_10411 [Achlya hypogyna]
MRDATGHVHTASHEISHALHAFYTTLYVAEVGPVAGAIDRFLDDTITTRLPSDMAERLCAPVLASKLHECFQNASRHKSPGPNALPYEILKPSPDNCFADDSQLFASNEAALQRQLALVDDFCGLSGFKLNRDKTQMLTHSPLPALPTLQIVQPQQPTKALGILVAPNLPPSARCYYALRRLRDRLLPWRHKATTLAGKAVILQSSIRLPASALVPTCVGGAGQHDGLQFINGEPPVIGRGAQGHRLLH